MLRMAQVQYIKDLYENEEKSLREISRITGHSFETVQKYAQKENWNEDNLPDTEPTSYPCLLYTSSVDGVEAMQIYYSKYLPGLLYCLCAPIYLFFQMRTASLPVAAMLFVISMGLMPLNNVFRKHIEKLKTEYWSCLLYTSSL